MGEEWRNSEEIQQILKKYKNESDLNNIITEIKNTLEGINIKLDDTEEQISNLEDRIIKLPNQKAKEPLDAVHKGQHQRAQRGVDMSLK